MDPLVKGACVCDGWCVDDFSDEWSEGAHESAREESYAGKSSKADFKRGYWPTMELNWFTHSEAREICDDIRRSRAYMAGMELEYGREGGTVANWLRKNVETKKKKRVFRLAFLRIRIYPMSLPAPWIAPLSVNLSKKIVALAFFYPKKSHLKR